MNGRMVTGGFTPAAKIRRIDDDTTLISLVGNGVWFLESTDDDWYGATIPYIKLSTSPNETTQTYVMENAASPLGCIQQYQFCHTALTDSGGCGPVGSFADALLGTVQLTSSDRVKTDLGWVFQQMATARLSDPLRILGQQALASQNRFYCGVQSSVPRNQWQIDATQWWATYLAEVQAAFVNAIVGLTDPILHKYIWTFQGLPGIPYERSDFDNICQNQVSIRFPFTLYLMADYPSKKIRSVAHMSFSLFGLCFLLLAGGLIMLISLVIEPILSCLYHRRKYKPYAYLDWVTNESLQLHRLAHEELGWGTWSHATNDIPIVQKDEPLAYLDMGNLDHPRLCLPDRSKQEETSSETGNKPQDLLEGRPVESVDGATTGTVRH